MSYSFSDFTEASAPVVLSLKTLLSICCIELISSNELKLAFSMYLVPGIFNHKKINKAIIDRIISGAKLNANRLYTIIQQYTWPEEVGHKCACTEKEKRYTETC